MPVSRILYAAPFSLFFICFFTGTNSVNVITLDSIEIFNTHGWFSSKPTVYFHCQGEENRTVLPDVKKTHLLYTFKGEESWQPLTDLPDKKCKRCGFYEKDAFESDDVYDEWELCPTDFADGKYKRFKENEFNATFICSNCTASHDFDEQQSHTTKKQNKLNVVLITIIVALACVIFMAGTVAAYKLWQKRKRDQDQARFLKLFEEGDDIEDELGLGPIF